MVKPDRVVIGSGCTRFDLKTRSSFLKEKKIEHIHARHTQSHGHKQDKSQVHLQYTHTNTSLLLRTKHIHRPRSITPNGQRQVTNGVHTSRKRPICCESAHVLTTQCCCEFAGLRLLLPAAHPIDSRFATTRVRVIPSAASRPWPLICYQVPSATDLLQIRTRCAFCCSKTRTWSPFYCSKTRTQPDFLTWSKHISDRIGSDCKLGLHLDQCLPNPNNPKPNRVDPNPTRPRFCPPLLLIIQVWDNTVMGCWKNHPISTEDILYMIILSEGTKNLLYRGTFKK